LASQGVVNEEEGPQLVGVLLSCASGYADLPSNSGVAEGLFRALFDCRVVLRTLRSLTVLLGVAPDDPLDNLRIELAADASDLRHIPPKTTAPELTKWAEEQEKRVYAELDSFGGHHLASLPVHTRFESVLWLQSAKFFVGHREVAPRRLLMVDDLQKLTHAQRESLLEELTILRPSIPIWLATRSIAIEGALLSQGAREGRDIREVVLEDLWGIAKGSHQFISFAQNVLDRRMQRQDEIPGATFQQCLREQFESEEVGRLVEIGVEAFQRSTLSKKGSVRYSEWLARAEKTAAEMSIEALIELSVTQILMTRDEAKRQLSFELALPAEELDEKDGSQIRSAAELFLHRDLGLPYYYGFERLCVMATNNVEELLSLAGALFSGVQARQVLRKGPELSPSEQEKLIKVTAKRKLEFVPKSHTEGARAKRLLTSIGQYCRDRTYLPNAPYAPGVTGVRLSNRELSKLTDSEVALADALRPLKRVLVECAAENLLVARPSAASTAREAGTIFYLNRTLCAHFDLPLQMGGWQDVSAMELVDWMSKGYVPPSRVLEMG
jgi:hypothetical protein